MMRIETRSTRTGTLEADVTAILSNIARLLANARWATVLPSIVDVAQRDHEFAEVHRQIQLGHAAPLTAALERAAGRGELPATVHVPDLVAGLLGPLFYRRWFSREPIDDRFVQTLAASVIRGQGPVSAT